MQSQNITEKSAKTSGQRSPPPEQLVPINTSKLPSSSLNLLPVKMTVEYTVGSTHAQSYLRLSTDIRTGLYDSTSSNSLSANLPLTPSVRLETPLEWLWIAH